MATVSSKVGDFFEITLKKPIRDDACGEGMSEDLLRQIIKSLQIKVVDKKFGGFVLTTADVPVKVYFGSDGEFDGIKAKLGGDLVHIVHGVNSKVLGIFEGPPTSQNPGPGWEVEPTLTQTYLNQSGPQSGWEIFFAKRVPTLI